MATRTIVTSQPDVECEVCERRLLRGEQPDVFLAAGRRRIVCELCAPRAAHEGWMRETDSQSLSMPPMRPRRGRSLFDRLRQVGKAPGDATGAPRPQRRPRPTPSPSRAPTTCSTATHAPAPCLRGPPRTEPSSRTRTARRRPPTGTRARRPPPRTPTCSGRRARAGLIPSSRPHTSKTRSRSSTRASSRGAWQA